MSVTLKDFSDIYTAVIEELGVPSTDTTTIARIKRDINIVYQQEVAPHRQWYWLLERTDIRHLKKYTTGTASVTEGSTSVTLSAGPATTVGDAGSFLNYKIKFDGFDEIYDITAHTAEATAVTLRSAYNGTTDADATYKIWKEALNLPTDCREVTKVWYERGGPNRTLESLGNEPFRDRVSLNPAYEGYPMCFSQIDHFDPSSGDGETETDRYRKIMIYPSISTNNVALHVEYMKETGVMTSDTDEPLIPIEDRVVLLYGALARAWVKHRSADAFTINQQLYQKKLGEMAAKYQAGTNQPKLAPAGTYMAYKRGNRIGRSGNR